MSMAEKSSRVDAPCRPLAMVAGGGPVGLVAALLLDRQGYRVEVIERASEPGGLMRSWVSPEGFSFDNGTRFAPRLGIPELDDALCPARSGGWLEFQQPPHGSVFGGRLCSRTGFLDATVLPQSLRDQVEAGYLAASRQPTDAESLTQTILADFGAPALKHIFGPAMTKVTGLGTDTLLPDSHRLFGLGRILLFDPERTQALKRDAAHDRCLAFHDRSEGAPATGRSFLYPRQGGTGRWVDSLIRLLQDRNVSLVCKDMIAEVRPLSGMSCSVRLGSGREAAVDRLVWTLPASMLLKTAGRGGASVPPPTSRTALTHFVADRAPTTDLFYVTFYDPALSSFRATFYTNVQGGPAQPGQYHFTVETILPEETDGAPDPQAIWAELISVGLIAPETLRLANHAQPIARGFPLPTPELLARSAADQAQAHSLLPGVTLLGRRADRVFFARDALAECVRQLGVAPTGRDAAA
jgi:hypothetical protein